MEHVEVGEFVWLAGDTSAGVSWMVDDVPVTLMDLLDYIAVPAAADWVIEQTLALLRPQLARIVALEDGTGGAPSSQAMQELAGALEADAEAAGVADLMEEFNRFAYSAQTFMRQVAQLFPEPARQPGRGRISTRRAPPHEAPRGMSEHRARPLSGPMRLP